MQTHSTRPNHYLNKFHFHLHAPLIWTKYYRPEKEQRHRTDGALCLVNTPHACSESYLRTKHPRERLCTSSQATLTNRSDSSRLHDPHLKAGLHVRRKHKHKHKPRVNRDDASTSARKRIRACACVVRVNQPFASIQVHRCNCLDLGSSDDALRGRITHGGGTALPCSEREVFAWWSQIIRERFPLLIGPE